MSIAVALVITFVAAAAIGYIAWAKFNQSWPWEPEQVGMCTKEAKVCPDGSIVGRSGPACEFADCPDEEDISSWKTYRNETHSFEIKYPSSWDELKYDPIYNYGDNAVLLRAEGESRGGLKISIDNVFSSNQTLEQFLGGPSKNVIETRSVTIAGSSAIQRKEFFEVAGFTTLTTYLKRGEWLYQFQLEPHYPGDLESYEESYISQSYTLEQEKIYNQILSSFKFVEPAKLIDTSSWKTYKNEKYGFEVMLPPYIQLAEKPLSTEGPGTPLVRFDTVMPSDFDNWAQGGITIYKADGFAEWSGETGWVFYDEGSVAWYETGIQSLDERDFSYIKKGIYKPEVTGKTVQGLDIYGGFGFGDAGYTAIDFLVHDKAAKGVAGQMFVFEQFSESPEFFDLESAEMEKIWGNIDKFWGDWKAIVKTLSVY